MYRKLVGPAALSLVLAACGGEAAEETVLEEPLEVEEPAVSVPAAGGGEQATARFVDAQGTEIGTATLTQGATGVDIAVDLTVPQAGEKGFHLHEVGSCETPAFTSAGSHFNPTDAQHGFDVAGGPHAGDLRNLEVESANGTVRGTMTAEMVTLAPGQPNSLLDADGSALVLHAGPDDYTTQPSGDSGDRIACGVIEAM